MRALWIVAGLMVLVLTATACPGPKATPPTAPATPPPTPTGITQPTPVTTPTPTPGVVAPIKKPKGELRVAISSFSAEGLVPHYMLTTTRPYGEYIYDDLVGVGKDGKFNKDLGLARDWKVSPDGKAWTLFLRQGVKFHNGEELTAEDVKFSLQQHAKPGATATNAPYIRANMVEVETPSRYEVVIKLKEPDFVFEYVLSILEGLQGLIFPKKYFEQVGEEGFASKPVGTGPWKFVERVVGSYVLFEANENHWRAVPPFKKLTLYVVPEESTRLALLRTGQADIVELSPESIPTVEKANMKVVINPYIAAAGIQMYKQYDQAFIYNDKRVRQALALALNVEEMTKFILERIGEPAGTIHVNPLIAGYEPGLKPYPHDPAQARKLLDEAGFPKGFELKVYGAAFPGAPQMPKLAEAAASYWTSIGLKPKIIPIEWGAFRPKYSARPQRFEPPGEVIPVRTGTRPSGIANLRLYYASEAAAGLMLLGSAHPQIDEFINKAAAEPSIPQREKILQQAARFIYDQYISLPIAFMGSAYGINPAKVKKWDFVQGVPHSLGLHTVSPD